MKSITSIKLAALISNGSPVQLIDVREPYEHEVFNIGGTLIPLMEITKNIELIEKEIPVVIYCRVGVRSQIAIQRLQDKFPFHNLLNLAGGMEAWKIQFPL
ncbi:MAG: rhodanese-like domain-containing protein [Ferruginibacter sp.]